MQVQQTSVQAGFGPQQPDDCPGIAAPAILSSRKRRVRQQSMCVWVCGWRWVWVCVIVCVSVPGYAGEQEQITIKVQGRHMKRICHPGDKCVIIIFDPGSRLGYNTMLNGLLI